jgi:F420-dependent oxidoreductase-like protein
MAMRFGLHTRPHDASMDALRRLWQYAEEAGFDWLSVYDHPFYAGNLLRHLRSQPVFESVAALAVMAATTRRARLGCIVFCVPYRNPCLLAKSAVTIDHISGGRFEVGLGAGWFEAEFREFGYGFPPLADRLDQLEEAIQVIRSLFQDERTTFHGRHYQVTDAICAPKPIQRSMPIWVGGMGERRTLAIAARYADGWNAYDLGPGAFRHKSRVLDTWCEKMGRDPATIPRTLNLGFYMGADEATAERKRRAIFATMDEALREGQIVGTARQVADRMGEYAAAGVHQINVTVPPPVDWDALHAFVEGVMRVFPSRPQ